MNTIGDAEARGALVRLLGSADRNSASTRALSVAVRIPEDPSPAVQRAWRERLEGSERSGAVALVRGAGNRRGVIERARLLNADRLARDLGVVRAGERAAVAVAAAHEASGGREGMEAAVEAAARKWESGEDWYRLPADPDLVRAAFAAAAGLFDVAFGTHFRAASAQAAGSSKFLERHGATVCAILRHALELPPETGQDEIWEMLGLVKFRHPVCVRAPLSFADPTGVAVPGSAIPWSAVNPDIVESCLPSKSDPAFVMTVENWTSFNGQCREIPRGAVVYTSGFPPPPVRQLVSRMASMWPNVPFFHWGDVDAGGLLIADSIRNAAGKPVKLHLMTPALAEQYGQKHRPLTRIAGIAVRDDDFGDLARYLSGEDCRVFEQEKAETDGSYGDGAVSRQFTDGEISAAIDRIATEGGTLSRTVVRKRLGGGSSSRIDALLKDYRQNGSGAANGASAGRPTAEVALPKTASNAADPQAGATKVAVASGMKAEPTPDELDARNIELIARLQSEIRILKILLESERKARADDAARHLQTIEALQHEIEIYRSVPWIGDSGRS